MLKNIKQNAKIVDIFIKKYFNTQKYSELVPVMKYGTLLVEKRLDQQSFLIHQKFLILDLIK